MNKKYKRLSKRVDELEKNQLNLLKNLPQIIVNILKELGIIEKNKNNE